MPTQLTFRDDESRRNWLSKQLPDASIAIAVRAVLRSLPALAFQIGRPGDLAWLPTFLRLTSTSFRASAIGYTSVKYSIKNLSVAAAAAAEAAADADHTSNAAYRAAFASDAAHAIASAVADKGAHAAHASYAINYANSAASDSGTWYAVMFDADEIEARSVSPASLIRRPLWPSAPPRWVEEA